MREQSVEEHLRDCVKAEDGRCIKMSPLGAVGIPDRLVLLPGLIGLVELKKPKNGKLSKAQSVWGEWLQDRRIPYWVLWTKGEVDDFIEWYRGSRLGDRKDGQRRVARHPGSPR